MAEQMTENTLDDQALAGVFEKNYERVTAAGIESRLKENLQALTVAISRLSQVLPRSEGRRAVYSFESLVDEVLAEPPKAHLWEVACNLIGKAAGGPGQPQQAVHAALDPLRPRLAERFGPLGSVQLREITRETVWPILILSDTLSEPKKGFVAPNANSIAQAYFYPTAWFQGVYAGDVPVGFLMIDDKPEEARYFLWRFMLAEPYHGRGYGRQAIECLIDHVRTRPGATELLVSCSQGEGSPEGFYRRLGFEPTGEKLGDEIVLRRPL